LFDFPCLSALVFLPVALLACNSETPATDDTLNDTDTQSETDTETDTKFTGCEAPLVVLQTGKDSTCAGGNQHAWPLGAGSDYCHGWASADSSGEQHQNSASGMQCNEDGSFSFTQYAGNITCSGEGKLKTFVLNECTQDYPPSLYSMGTNFACCQDPASAECQVGIPTVSVPGGQVYLNGELCEE